MTPEPLLPAPNAARDLPIIFNGGPKGGPSARLSFEGLPGMAFLARNDRERTVEAAGAGCETLLGRPAPPKPFALAPLIHGEDREQVLAAVQAAVAASRPFAVEYRLRHVSGEWRTVWEQGRPAGRGSAATVQAQLLDITPRSERDQARLAMELRRLQLQEFHTLNELAAGLAHEFNNLVAGILGSAELLGMDLPETHPGRESLKQIFEATRYARDFVHKLRAVGERPPPDFKPVRLQPVIEECLQILRTIIPAKVELAAEVEADCAPVEADAAQIHQAILDLCLFAWQGLADRRGRIKISLKNGAAGRLPAGASSRLRPGPHVCLSVEDNGRGLDKPMRDHVFHPFRMRRQGGTKVGLELFLVREIIHGHQGAIILDSEPGGGLNFRIYLPAATGQVLI